MIIVIELRNFINDHEMKIVPSLEEEMYSTTKVSFR